MAEITKKEIEHLALLSRLSLSEEEKNTLSQQIKEILNYVEKVNELNTENVTPTFNVLPLGERLREDKVDNKFDSQSLLRNAPESEGNFFKVPKIV
ncbi:MAG: Asp-tRNA(Asn)/Glu-tRNA(Gln) amidotransferase subunit GatC [bacterium]|nr:Asp-tRNA(Asn)/Glu-tRNA(Gln) amidotransferase subunit GatC [bacterium]